MSLLARLILLLAISCSLDMSTAKKAAKKEPDAKQPVLPEKQPPLLPMKKMPSAGGKKLSPIKEDPDGESNPGTPKHLFSPIAPPKEEHKDPAKHVDLTGSDSGSEEDADELALQILILKKKIADKKRKAGVKQPHEPAISNSSSSSSHPPPEAPPLKKFKPSTDPAWEFEKISMDLVTSEVTEVPDMLKNLALSAVSAGSDARKLLAHAKILSIGQLSKQTLSDLRKNYLISTDIATDIASLIEAGKALNAASATTVESSEVDKIREQMFQDFWTVGPKVLDNQDAVRLRDMYMSGIAFSPTATIIEPVLKVHGLASYNYALLNNAGKGKGKSLDVHSARKAAAEHLCRLEPPHLQSNSPYAISSKMFHEMRLPSQIPYSLSSEIPPRCPSPLSRSSSWRE